MRLDEALRCRQAKPGATALRREERREDLVTDRGRDSGTLVADGYAAPRLVGADGDTNRAVVLHGVRGIDQQVVNYHLQHLGITSDRRRRAADRDLDVRGVTIALQQVGGGRHQRHQLDRRLLRLRRAREQQQVFHHRVEGIDARHDFLHHRRVGALRRQASADHLHRTANAGQRILDLVRDDRRQFPQSRELGLLSQPGLELDTRRQVMKDAGEATLAFRDRLPDRQMQWKGRAVLASSGDLSSPADDLRLARFAIA